MGDLSVLDIKVTELLKIEVDGGNVFRCLKNSDGGYKDFGEAYFSFVKKNFIKAWKIHKKMTLNLIVPSGSVKFVFFDGKKNFREIISGRDDYKRITVPPKIWFGFQGLEEENLILNIANIRHDNNEVERKDINLIDYTWNKNQQK
jgi:dTDP-4-dehydrorhamnose 3,5-epimerase